MNRRSILKFLTLAAIDPEVLIWTPGKKTIIEGPRYTFDQWQQWNEFKKVKLLWLDVLNGPYKYGWLGIQPDIYDRFRAADLRAKELGLI